MSDNMDCNVLHGYEAMAAVSGRMLDAARVSDWDRFIAEERRCHELVEVLKARIGDGLSEAQRARKFVLLRKILADDAQIRNLAEPWMQQLQGIMASSGNSRRLGESYGSQP